MKMETRRVDIETAQCSFLFLLLIISIQLDISVAQLPPPRPTKGVRIYLGSVKKVLPNYSFISEEHISTLPPNGLWCQSAASNMNGTWYQPNGRPIPTGGGTTNLPLQAMADEGQVGLVRNSLGQPVNNEGFYKCVIADENGNSTELFVAIYTNTNYDNTVGPQTDNDSLQFSLLSETSLSSPVFTLSFNVSKRPPTNVSCTLNDSLLLSIEERDIHREIIQYNDPILVQVTVRLRRRESGEYKCTVSNSRVDGVDVFEANTSTKVITVTDPVSDLQGQRLNSSSISLSWSPPPSLRMVVGYEIYYKFDNNRTQSVTVHDQLTTNFVVTHLTKDVHYEIFVIAFGADLPSVPVKVTNITTATDRSVLEVCGGPFTECDTWKVSTKLIVASIFKSALIQIIQDDCSCDFYNHYTITNDSFQCGSVATRGQVQYSATLTKTDLDASLTSAQILTLIRDMLTHGVTVHDGSNSVTLTNNCSTTSINTDKDIVTRNETCSPSIITTTVTLTTVTITPSPKPTIHLDYPTRDSNTNGQQLNSTQVYSIGGSILLIAVLLMTILIVSILIIAKIKYDRLKAKLFVKIKSNMNDFEMIECGAYQSTDELRDITNCGSTIEPYSTLSHSITKSHDTNSTCYWIKTRELTTPLNNEVKKDVPPVYEYIH